MEVLPIDVSGFSSAVSVNNHLKLQLLVRAYQVQGYCIACLNLLGILNPNLSPDVPEELKIEHYGWTELDLDCKMCLGPGLLPHLSRLAFRQLDGEEGG
ncbi:hypothetical protein ACQY0O_008028 [Thecaphora frezii]